LNPFVRVVFEAAKVAAVVWIVVVVDPLLEETFPRVDAGWRYLVSAVLFAALLEGGLQLLFGWPRIVVEWSCKTSDVSSSRITARIPQRKIDSQAFELRVSTPTGGWLGYQVLRLLMLLGVTLQIRVDRAAVLPSVENYHTIAGVPTVTPDSVSRGFNVALGSAPSRPGTWHWARVTWADDGHLDDVECNIDYVLWHPSWLARCVLLFVWKTKNAGRFQVVRS